MNKEINLTPIVDRKNPTLTINITLKDLIKDAKREVFDDIEKELLSPTHYSPVILRELKEKHLNTQDTEKLKEGENGKSR